MSTPEKKRLRIVSIHKMWEEWLSSAGMLALAVAIGPFVSKTWLPLMVLLMAWVPMYVVTSSQRGLLMRCQRTAKVCGRSLVTSAVIMFVCLICTRTDVLGRWIDPDELNPSIPYIAALIIFPTTAFWAFVTLVRTGRSKHCRECMQRLGYRSMADMCRTVMHREAVVQMRLLAWGCFALTIICTVYYIGWYTNISFNGRDKYFFMAVPLTAFLISLFYTGQRYKRILDVWTGKYTRTEARNDVRFLVIRKDKVLVTKETLHGLLDTPCVMQTTAPLNIEEAKGKIEQKLGCKVDVVKRLYDSDSPDGAHLQHFACMIAECIPEEEVKLSGKWMTLFEISTLSRMGMVSTTLVAELMRIYTVTMAWKTYTPDAKRLYPIKNYKPTFRLRDFGQWDVDYSDPLWLKVAADNEDKRLFRLRRFLKKLVGA